MILFVKLAVSLAALYLLAIVLIALAQDWLLFPRWATGNGSVVLPTSAERLTLEVASGEEVVGIRLPVEARPAAEAALILGFGGNTWNADMLAAYLHSVFLDREVVAFHYRGYAPSTGRPSASSDPSGCAFDPRSPGCHPRAKADRGCRTEHRRRPGRLLASQRPITGLILVTPLNSLEALAREHYPWAPVGLLLRHRMEIAETVAASSAPWRASQLGQDTSDQPPVRSSTAGPRAILCWTALSRMPVTTISMTGWISSALSARPCPLSRQEVALSPTTTIDGQRRCQLLAGNARCLIARPRTNSGHGTGRLGAAGVEVRVGNPAACALSRHLAVASHRDRARRHRRRDLRPLGRLAAGPAMIESLVRASWQAEGAGGAKLRTPGRAVRVALGGSANSLLGAADGFANLDSDGA